MTYNLTPKTLIFTFFVVVTPLFVNAQVKIKVQFTSNSETLKNAVSEFTELFKHAVGYTPRVVSSNGTNRIIIEVRSPKVGEVEYEKLGSDGFVIKNTPNGCLVISGNTERGTEYGMYFFLEKYLGVKWLMPTALWTEVAENKFFKIPELDLSVTPHFKTRKFSPIDLSLQDDFGEWGRRNLLISEIDYHHNLYKLFSETNEFYPKVNSETLIPSSKSDQGWQPNFRAQNIVDYSVKIIDNYFQVNPEKGSYSLGINDSKNFDDSNLADSKNKLGLRSASAVYYRWVNRTVVELNKKYPDKKYGLLAYENVMSPPGFPLPKNVIPFITLERLKWADGHYRKSDIENLKSWGKNVEEVGWYDYVYGLNYIVPRPYFTLMSEYLQFGFLHGVKHYVAEFYTNPLEGPKGWILSKLLWNSELNSSELLKEWCVSAFGEDSAPYMIEFYNIWERFWTDDILKSNWWDSYPGFPYLRFDKLSYIQSIPLSYMDRSDKLINLALQSAKNRKHTDRLNELASIWNYSKLSFSYFNKTMIPGMTTSSSATIEDLNKCLDFLRKNKKNQIFVDYSKKINK